MVFIFDQCEPKVKSLCNIECTSHSIKFNQNLFGKFEGETDGWTDSLLFMHSCS